MCKVLIVEDEFIIARSYQLCLQQAGFEVVGIATSADEAFDLAMSGKPQVVLMDIFLKNRSSGIEAARKIVEINWLPIIYISGNSDSATKEEALKVEGSQFIQKPVNMKILLENIKRTIERLEL